MSAARLPATVRPMLATLGPMPEGQDWAYDFKWDGVRAIISTAGDKVRAISRNDLDITVSYPELNTLPSQVGGRRLVLDGELITLDERGTTSFSLLQQRMHTKNPAQTLISKIPVLFYAFDLLWLDNASLLDWSYTRRREALESLALKGTAPMSVPPSFDGPGQAPDDVIAHHRAFIAQRRTFRPASEYRDLTTAEWDEFLGHFELRKVSLGVCTRDYGTPCAHEHACVRCPLLRPDPAQMARLTELRDNLQDRLTEAHDMGWLGEVAGLEASLEAAERKLAAMRNLATEHRTVHLGMPDFRHSTGRISQE